MTRIYFIRHAQPDETWLEDRTRPLTQIGLKDSEKVSLLLINVQINRFISSPYKRSVDTISKSAEMYNMDIQIDERFRERLSGIGGHAVNILEKRWSDFDFCEQDGESLGSVQHRNIEALKEVLHLYCNQNIVIGTHGTALSTIMNYYNSSFGCEGFKRIWHWMPYIIRLDFDGENLVGSEEMLCIERGY